MKLFITNVMSILVAMTIFEFMKLFLTPYLLAYLLQ